MKKKINNGIFYVVISLVAVLAIGSVAAIGYSGYGTPKVVVEGNYIEAVQPVVEEVEALGVAAGTDHYVAERFWAGFGGAVLATTTISTSETITEGLLEKYSVFEITPLTNALTWTLPATTTLTTLLKNAGDTRTWLFHNATTTTSALATFTLAKGNGWELVGVDANVDVIAGAAAMSQVYLKAECTRLFIGATTTHMSLSGNIVCALTDNIAVD